MDVLQINSHSESSGVSEEEKVERLGDKGSGV